MIKQQILDKHLKTLIENDKDAWFKFEEMKTMPEYKAVLNAMTELEELLVKNNGVLPVVNGWHTLEIQPPDEMVEVEDKNGNRAWAIPTYYPFRLGENKTGRKWGSEVTHCEPYWDGGWMIQCEGLTSNIDSDIVRWRACR